MNNTECFFFQPTDYTSSATVCKWCGKEKYQHKSEQKQLIIDIMNEDAKDGLYKQQTAVEWFANELAKKGLLVIRDYKNLIAYRQAKEMEKQQKMECWETAHQAGRFEGKGIAEENWQTFEQYYKEEYGKL